MRNQDIAIFYKTYLFTPSGEKEIMITQGINKGYELWNLICSLGDVEALGAREWDSILDGLLKSVPVTARRDDTFICFLHFDHIKFIPIYFDNASITIEFRDYAFKLIHKPSEDYTLNSEIAKIIERFFGISVAEAKAEVKK